ncbi:MAG: TatD family hydrolase [Flavobacteriaceae bacterium]|nr:TatD family hydrolase [Flavobacteriaceae bacterium]
MILTDTHTHLYSSEFDKDRDLVIKRAKDSGVNRFFIPAIDSHYHENMFVLEKKHPNMFLMMGLHPTSVKENFREELAVVKNKLAQRSFFAVGEIGIDLYWDDTFLRAQQEAFKTQIAWAKEYNLPIVIHCRNAFDEIFKILEAEKSSELRGIFHCFTGTLAQAQKAIGYNMKLGIGGVVTFKNGRIDKFLNQIDLQHIVLETDAPYLAPSPNRGKRNESSYLCLIAQKLAEIYSVPIEEIAAITTQNSIHVFGI